VIAENGSLVGDPDRVIKIVTLNFLADGGDGYPYPDLGENRVDLNDRLAGNPMTTFAPPGTEQDALATFLANNHADVANAFNQEETSPAKDERIQNLNERADGLAGASIAAAMPDDTQLRAFPVPMQHQLNVELPELKSEGTIVVSIQDLQTGQELYRGNFNSLEQINDQIHFDFSHIQRLGIYSLKLQMTDGRVMYRKILK
jgi:hypothetical protein